MAARGRYEKPYEKSTAAVMSPDGGPPRLALPWLFYGISLIGSVATVVAAAFSALAGGSLSGIWLVMVFLAPQVGLLLALAYQAHAFSKAYTDVADSFQEAMLHESQKIESLETALGVSEVYRGMVGQVTDAVSHVTASLVRANTRLDDKALAQLLRETCEKMASAFSRSRSVPCRVCVKQVMEKPDEPGRPYVKAVARNTGVTREDKKRWHLVEDNTDFDALLFSQLDYWFCPDVQDRTLVPQYSNTSPGDHPYRSVVVWPIKARTGKSDKNSLSEGYDVAAFLCLDASEPNAFDAVSDVPMGALVAQALGRAFESHYASFPTGDTNREKSE